MNATSQESNSFSLSSHCLPVVLCLGVRHEISALQFTVLIGVVLYR